MCSITTPRLCIRPFAADDWRDLYEYLSQEEAVRFEPYDAFTEDEARREALDRSRDGDYHAVCLLGEGKLIGSLYLSRRDCGTMEFGYVFNPKYWGSGYATEAARALMTRAFEDGSARRIAAGCDPRNERSWKLLERLGFRREGRLIKNVWFKKDASGAPIWKDTYLYGLLKEEWD